MLEWYAGSVARATEESRIIVQWPPGHVSSPLR